MTKMIFLNLPVTDLERSIAFYQAIGATKNEQFSDGTAACMVFSDVIHVMLLTHAKFSQFTPKAIADAARSSEVLICLSAESRADVDATLERAGGAGGRVDLTPPADHGFMYHRNFEDPDGHVWEIMWMDPAAAMPQDDVPALAI